MRSSRTSLVLALVIFAAALSAYVGLRSLVTSAGAEVTRINKEVEAKNAAAAHLVSVRDRLEELAGVERAVNACFVPDTAVVAFIDELEARGRAVGAAVQINSVSGSSADKTGHGALKITLSITGPFDAVVRTLGSIEYAPYDLVLTNLSLLSDPSKGGWTANASFSVGSIKGGTQDMPVTSVPSESASTTPSAPPATTTQTTTKQP